MTSPPSTMRSRGVEDFHTRVLRRAADPDHDRWLAHVSAARGCVRPVRLIGALHTVEPATGRIIDTRHTTTDLPDGVIYVPCGDRRATVCPACAETYRADTYQLIKAGLVGGKGVPDTVARHPVVFATATAPSFGPVHSRSVNPRTGKVRPCRMRRDITRCPHGHQLVCTKRHAADDPRLGRPICLDCYDHAAHVVWNGFVGELWRRTTITLARALRPLERAHRVRLRISFGKVAEYQRRGVVHLHALIRLDQIDPTDPDLVLRPPTAITAAELAQLVTAAVNGTRFLTPDYADTGHTWPIEWGPQLDVRPVTRSTHDAQGTPDVSTDAVAAYLAKYATKATEPTGLPVTGRMNAETAEHYADPDTHIGRLIAYAWQLGGRPSNWTSDEQRQRWHDTYGRLQRWTHMLGFGGHFATKSRRYSTTHKALRAERREWRRATRNNWWNHHHPAAHDIDDDHGDEAETTLIVADLHLAGIGWNTTADAYLAAAAAARARDHRAFLREEHIRHEHQ